MIFFDKMTIQYQYKELGGNYNNLQPIEDNEEKIFNDPGLDKNKVFIFNIIVSDSIGGTPYAREHTLGKGVFPLYIDIKKQSVSVDKFPLYDKSLEASGMFSLGERNAVRIEVGESVEIPVFLALCSGLVNFRMSAANLEIAKLFYVFRSNQYFGIHKTLVDESYGNTAQYVPTETSNREDGYVFKFTNNYSSAVDIRYGILELC